MEGHEIIDVIIFPGLGADGTSLEHKKPYRMFIVVYRRVLR